MLSDYYDEVCIIERDELPSEPANRQGVPQSFHPHRVLPRGGLILEHYFPGYNDELVALGAIPSHEEKFMIANRYGTLVNMANVALIQNCIEQREPCWNGYCVSESRT